MAHLNITLDEQTLKELMLGDRDEAVSKLLEAVFNAVLSAEATEQLGAESYERTDGRVTYRNGYRSRQLTTRVGSLTLHVPKFREGTFSTQLFSRYERSEQALLLSLMEMVIQGVSTRKVEKITETLCGTSFSKSTVSALCANLDPIVDDFRNRPLTASYPFIMLDAIYMKARDRGAVRSKGMLIAMGVNLEGHREILGFQVGDGESYESWSEFFAGLKERGLANVDFVVSDNHGGLVKAIREQFCNAVWQRCQTHFSRNLLDKIPKRHRTTVHTRLRDMYDSPDYEAACQRRDALLGLLETMSPQAHDLLDEAFEDVMAVLSLPARYRRRLCTTNSIERLNEEIRRRERVIRIFPNEASITRLIGALLLDHHERWISGRAYLSMGDYLFAKDRSGLACAQANPERQQVA
jgi:transposase-like protein